MVSTIDEDSATWKANFKKNLNLIAENYSIGEDDVDAFAAAVAEKVPGVDGVETKDDLMEQVDSDAEESVENIFSEYQNNASGSIESTDQIKRLIIEQADGVTYDESQDVEDQLDSALDEFASDWANNWSSAFGL